MSEGISASLEDYLEAIFLAAGEKGVARAKDIAGHLGVTSSSVTGALHALSERNLINYAPYEVITLTAEGEKTAREVLRRHEALRSFLIKVLAVDETQAEPAACAMEHVLPRPVLERLIRFVAFMETCPRGGADWTEHFSSFCHEGEEEKDCEACLQKCLEAVRSDKTAGEGTRR